MRGPRIALCRWQYIQIREKNGYYEVASIPNAASPHAFVPRSADARQEHRRRVALDLPRRCSTSDLLRQVTQHCVAPPGYLAHLEAARGRGISGRNP